MVQTGICRDQPIVMEKEYRQEDIGEGFSKVRMCQQMQWTCAQDVIQK